MATNSKKIQKPRRKLSEAQEQKLAERAETIGKKLIGEIDAEPQGN